MNSLTSHLRVAALPVPIAPNNVAANLEFVVDKCTGLPSGVDVLVLPELFSTGFHPKMAIDTLAEEETGNTVTTLLTLSKLYGVAIAGSFLCKDAERYFNRAFFIEPSGEVTFYDKHHLFTAGAEGTLLTAGAALPPVVRFRGWNISIVTCYDLRFPGWCRNRNSAYDLLIVPANWPVERGYAWEHLLIARAIENQSAVVGANRSGEDGFGHYDNTFIFDCKGQPVGSESDGFVCAELDKTEQQQYREDFPALREWDSFSF